MKQLVLVDDSEHIDLYAEMVKPSVRRKPWIDFTPPSAEKVYQVLSYGAGKQTFYMLVAIEQGLLPKPDMVIFADTQYENKLTYEHIEKVVKPLCKKLGLEFVIVTRGDIYQYHMENNIVMLPPRCTDKFKIRVINKYLKDKFNLKSGTHGVDVWIGISTDEAHRADSVSLVAYTRSVFPLITLDKSRNDCINGIVDAGYPVPIKSGCDGCPHISMKGWKIIRQTDPERFNKALELELNAQKRDPAAHLPMYGRHNSLKVLSLQLTLDDLLGSNLEKNIDDVNCSSGYCFV